MDNLVGSGMKKSFLKLSFIVLLNRKMSIIKMASSVIKYLLPCPH